MPERWAVLWRSQNCLDGKREYFLWECGNPMLFTTRAQARSYIKERYGYIATRPDLRAEPHGWRSPKAVKVRVILVPTRA